MSDNESEPVMVAIEEEEEVNDLDSAVRRVLKNALAVDGVCKGLHECAKVLDAGKAQMCFVAEDCNSDPYKTLVTALCGDKSVPLVNVPDRKKLGEWAGLCKVDGEGNANKVVGASCVVVHDFGEDSPGLAFLNGMK